MLLSLHARSQAADGVKYMADEAGAYWLLDIIASYQTDAKIRREPFQVWELKLSVCDLIVVARKIEAALRQ